MVQRTERVILDWSSPLKCSKFTGHEKINRCRKGANRSTTKFYSAGILKVYNTVLLATEH